MLLAAACWPSAAQGQTTYSFTATGSNADYATGANWSGGIVPTGTTTDVVIGNGGATRSSLFQSGTTYSARNMFIGTGTGSVGTLTLGGSGTLSFTGGEWTNGVYVGQNGGTGTLNVNAGLFQSINASTSQGDITLASGGTNTSGFLTVAGGTVSTYRLILGDARNSTAVATLNSGAINLSGTGLGFRGNLVFGGGNTAGTSQTEFNLNGGTLTTVGVLIAVQPSSATFNFNGGVIVPTASTTSFLGSGITYNVLSGGAIFNTNGYNITVPVALAGSGSSAGGGLQKLGSGTLTLSGTNTYTGTTSINAGTLAITNASALLNSTLDLNASDSGAVSFSQNSTLGGLTGSRNLDMGTRTLSIGNNNASTIYSGILSNGALTKVGSGTLALSAGNTFTGATTINAGVISLTGLSGTGSGGSASELANTAITVNAGATLFAGATTSGQNSHLINKDLTLNGGTVASNGVSGNNNYNFAIGTGGRILALGGTTSAISASLGLNGQREFQVGAGSTLIVSGQVANWEGQAWGTINKTGAGVLQLTNSGNGYGGLMLSAGTVAVSAGSWANTGGNGYLADFQGFATLTWAAGNTTDISASNKFRILDGITATLDTGANAVTLGTAIVLGASKTGALTKVGAGTLTLSASNGYTGVTTINGGVLALNNTNALAGGGNISFGGGTLQFSSNNTNDYSSKIKSSGSAISIDTNGNNVTFASILDSTNTGGFTKLGSGTLSMTSGASTFTGPVTISQGAVSVTTSANGGALSSASSLTVATGATLVMTTTGGGKNALPVNAPWTINGSLTISAASTGQDFGNNMTLNSGTVSGSGGSNFGWLYWYGGTLAATGTSALSSASAIGFGSATVNTPNAGDLLTITAPIGASSANSGSLTKTGAGTLTLSGSNTYTGATTISAGILSFGGTNGLRGTSGVTIAGGAGLTYTGGAATFGKNVTVTAGSGTGTITNSGGGLLTLSGSLSKDNSVLRLTGGSFNVTGLITGTTVGSSDLVVDAASVTLSNTNSYDGPTYVINAGTLVLGTNGAIPAGSDLYLGNGGSAGVLNLNGFSNTVNRLTLVSGSVFGAGTLTAGTYALQGGTVAANLGAGTISVGGNSILTGSAAAGTVNINAGTFTLSSGGLLASTAAVNATANGATLDISGLSGSGLTIGSLSGTAGSIVTLGGKTLTFGDGSATTFAGAIGGTGGITKQGAGEVTLSGSNGFSGATAINAGSISFGNKNAFSATSGISIAGGAGLTYTGAADTFSRNITVSTGTGTVTNSGSGVLTLGGTLTKNGTVLRLTGAGGFNVTGQIVGSSSNSDLVVDGASVTLSNTNSYNGPTYVYNSGTLSLGIDNAIPNMSAVWLGNATSRGTLVTGTFSDSISQLLFSGSGGTVSLSGDKTASAQLATAGSLTLGSNASLVLTNAGTSAGLYRLISATSISGAFGSISGTSAAYQILTTSTSIDYQQRAVLGAVTVTNPAAIITGGSAAFTYSVANGAFSGGADLAVTGTGLSNVIGTSSGTAAGGGSTGSLSGLVFTGTGVGAGQQGTFTVNAPAAYGSTSTTGTVSVDVYAHASGSAAGTTIALADSIVGYSGSLSGLTSATVSNAAGYRVNLMTTGGTSAGFVNINNVSGIAAGSSALISASAVLSGSQAIGANSLGQVFNLTYADNSALAGASNNLGGQSITVTGKVLDHATSSLAGSLLTSTTISLGTWNYATNQWEGGGSGTGLFDIFNIASSYGAPLTADLALLGVSGTSNGFSTNLNTFTDIAGGGSRQYSILTNTAGWTTSGLRTATFTLSMSDKVGMAGATPSNTLSVTAQVIVVPEPGSLALAGIGIAAAAWACRRRR